MIIFYSRKWQLLLLLCWCLGMAFMYGQITGERPPWIAEAFEKVPAGGEKARLGMMPEIPAQDHPHPAADAHLNRCLALRVVKSASEQADTLVVEMDYIAAQPKGFIIEEARDYYLSDEPTYVVAFGEPWTSDIANASFPVSMPQVTGLNLIVSKSRHLRLLVHTRAMREAMGAKLHISPTGTGLKAVIRFPR